MVHDERFRESIFNTVYFTGASVPLTMAHRARCSRCCSTSRSAAAALFRTAYYLPVVTPFVVSAILWKWLYNGDYGLFNYYLLKAHVIDEPLLWLSDKNLAMPSVIMMSVWAASASRWWSTSPACSRSPRSSTSRPSSTAPAPWPRLRYITIPMLRPTTLFLLVIGIIGSLQVFTQIFIMTSGGPVDKTTTMVYYIYSGPSSTTTWAMRAPWRSRCS